MAYPVFSSGDVLPASDMNAIGMWLVASTSFTGAGVVIINNCFTSNYTNYMVNINLRGSTAAQPFIKLRAGGTDASSAYNYGGYYIAMSGGAITGEGALGGTSGFRIGAYGANEYGSNTYIYNPAVAVSSTYTSNCQAAEDYARYFGGYHGTAAAYDGMSLVLSSGTVTGRIRIYGMRN